MTTDEIQNVYPLTDSQQGMLFHALAAPSETFVEQLGVELAGKVDAAALRQAWQAVLDRTDVLRSQVVWEGMDQPLQVVRGHVGLPLTVLDWRDTPPAELAGRWAEWAREDRAAGIDTSRAPLWRATALLTAPDRCWLVWTFHHLLLDGWSVAMLLTDLAAAYRATVAGTAAALPRRRPFADYVAWLARQDHSAGTAFWQAELAGLDQPTLLPTGPGTGRQAGRVARYAERSVTLDEQTTSRLAGRRNATLSAVVEAAWAGLLSRYTGRDDVVFGVTDSGRAIPLRGVETSVGMFINAYPTRVAAPPDRPLWSVVAELVERRADRQRHAAVPHDSVRRAAGLPGGAAPYDTALVVENYPDADATDWGPGLSPLALRYVGGRADYAVSLFVLPGDRLELRAVHDTDRVPDAAALLDHLVALLTAMANDPAARVGDVALLTDVRRRQLTDWGHGPAGGAPTTVPALFAARVAAAPDAIAVVHPTGQLTYADVDRRSMALASTLQERLRDDRQP